MLCEADIWNVVVKGSLASEEFRQCLGSHPWPQPALPVLEGSCEHRLCFLQAHSELSSLIMALQSQESTRAGAWELGCEFTAAAWSLAVGQKRTWGSSNCWALGCSLCVGSFCLCSRNGRAAQHQADLEAGSRPCVQSADSDREQVKDLGKTRHPDRELGLPSNASSPFFLTCHTSGSEVVGHTLLSELAVPIALQVLCSVLGPGAPLQICTAFSNDLTKDLYNCVALLKTCFGGRARQPLPGPAAVKVQHLVTTPTAEAVASIPGQRWGSGRAGLPDPGSAAFVLRK